MQVKFIRDWTRYYTAGSTAVIGPGGLSKGQFIELKKRGMVEVIDQEPENYRVAVQAKPATRRKSGRARRTN